MVLAKELGCRIPVCVIMHTCYKQFSVFGNTQHEGLVLKEEDEIYILAL